MLCIKGKSVYGSIAAGPIKVLKKQKSTVNDSRITDAEAELSRVTEAIERAKRQLAELYDNVLVRSGKESAAIIEVQQMMLEDDDYLDAIYALIREEQYNAEYAVDTTGNKFADIFAAIEDDYMRARAVDVKDVSARIVRILENIEEVNLNGIKPSIIVADDLSPSETAQMDKSKILAFATVHGSVNSHTAILARMMNIPALVMVPMDLEQLSTGMDAIVDGFGGEIIFEPTDEVKRTAIAKMEEQKRKRNLLEELKGLETISKSGRRMHLYANISNVEEVDYVLENDAEGIGLFRSEFLYLGRNDLPSEDEQFKAYKTVLSAMGEKKVIIRTLDLGADKQAEYLDLGKEDNPALGYRAIRICLTQKDIFKIQLRALLRAAVYGNLSVMYPMIISPKEVEEIKKITEEVETDLRTEGVPYRIPEQGIMIETPASVMMADELAQMVDFFSIGTNDLTQYTLAIDRQNAKLERFYDAHHPAVLRMIRMAVESAHANGIWVGICGELGADTELTETFLDMGIDELSVAPSSVLRIRKIIREAE